MAAKSTSKAKGYTVDAGALAAHLKVLSMKGRISDAVFTEDFGIVASDMDDEVTVKALSPIQFPEKFAVSDFKHFVKIIKHFKTEVKLSMDGDNIVVDQGGSKLYYRCAARKVLLEEMKTKRISDVEGFNTAVDQLIGDNPLIVSVGATDAMDLDGFRKLMDASIAQFVIDNGTVRVIQTNLTDHKTDSLLGKIENKEVLESHKRFMSDFKVSGELLSDLMDGIRMDPNDDDDVIFFDFGPGGLQIRYEGGNYVFLISPQIRPLDSIDDDEGEV